MSRYITTELGGIVLPSGFVKVGQTGGYYRVYLSWSVIEHFFEGLVLRARFTQEPRSVVVTYGNTRWSSIPPKMETLLSQQSDIESPMLHELISVVLIGGEGLRSGHDAFVFAAHPLGGDGFDGLGEKIVIPKQPPPDRHFWRLLAVVERN